MVLERVALAAASIERPPPPVPPVEALLATVTLFMTSVEPAVEKMPPPPDVAEFEDNVLLVIVIMPALRTAPPGLVPSAELTFMVEAFRVSVPPLKMPPPPPWPAFSMAVQLFSVSVEPLLL
jgi:hypothetical protein